MIDYLAFPSVENSNEDGLLAHGGDLEVSTLVSAYAQGIFPWFNDDQPILWWSPDPRMVLYPENVKISRSLRKTIRQNRFDIRCNTQFERIISNCALRGAPSLEEVTEETWITESVHTAYQQLHAEGYAHSIEVYEDNQLVGGLYGLALGDVFFGESMFSLVSNASKVALSALCAYLGEQNFKVIDCQVSSDHLFSMGAEEITRVDFINYLTDINTNIKNANAKTIRTELPDNITSHLIKAVTTP